MKNQYQHPHTTQSQDTYKETIVSLIQDLRAEVDVELLTQTGLYRAEDTQTNIRIVEDIRKAIENMHKEEPTPKHIAEVAIATNENVQIRDFLMGIRSEKFAVHNIFDYLLLLSSAVNKDVAIPLTTVFSTYLYEASKDEAKSIIEEVLKINPDYNLAKLLKRVYATDVDSSFISSMGEELHSKVVDVIYDREGK